MSDFLRQHWKPLVVALLFAVALGTVAYRLLASTIRGAVLAVRKPKQLGESGAAAAEFVITVIPFMLMLTALMQLALASMGRVLVSYAAFCAARAAVVFVPMKPEEVEGASASSKLGQAFTEEMANHIGYGANSRTDFAISHKAALVRNAAAYALIATSPSIDVVASDIANNWEQYLIERLKHGLDPLKYLQSLLGDIAGLPGPLLENLADQLKDVIQGGLDTPEAKKAAKDKLDAWLDGALQGNPALRDKVKAAVENYIDKYKGSAESPTGQLGDLVKNTINNTLQGPLEKWKDKVSQSIDASLPGGGGGASRVIRSIARSTLDLAPAPTARGRDPALDAQAGVRQDRHRGHAPRRERQVQNQVRVERADPRARHLPLLLSDSAGQPLRRPPVLRSIE